MVSLAHTRKSMSLGAVASSARLMCLWGGQHLFRREIERDFRLSCPNNDVWSSGQIGEKSTKGPEIAVDRLRSQGTPHFVLRYPASPFLAGILANGPGTDIDPETQSQVLGPLFRGTHLGSELAEPTAYRQKMTKMLPTHVRGQINHLIIPGHTPLVPLQCHSTVLERMGNGAFPFRRWLKDLKLVEADSDSIAHMPHAPAFRRDLRQEVLRKSFQVRRTVEDKEHTQALLEQPDIVFRVCIALARQRVHHPFALLLQEVRSKVRLGGSGDLESNAD